MRYTVTRTETWDVQYEVEAESEDDAITYASNGRIVSRELLGVDNEAVCEIEFFGDIESHVTDLRQIMIGDPR